MSPRYAAGFFDGEGSIYAAVRRYRKHSSPTLIVCISNTHKEVLELFHAEWGGSLLPRKNKRGLRWKQQYQWALAAKMARGFLKTIRPYVIVKKEIVELAIEYGDVMEWPRSKRIRQTTVFRNGRNWTAPVVLPEYRAEITRIWNKMREVNRLGAPHNARRKYENPFGAD